jgi:hypothetical protein
MSPKFTISRPSGCPIAAAEPSGASQWEVTNQQQPLLNLQALGWDALHRTQSIHYPHFTALLGIHRQVRPILGPTGRHQALGPVILGQLRRALNRRVRRIDCSVGLSLRTRPGPLGHANPGRPPQGGRAPERCPERRAGHRDESGDGAFSVGWKSPGPRSRTDKEVFAGQRYVVETAPCHQEGLRTCVRGVGLCQVASAVGQHLEPVLPVDRLETPLPFGRDLPHHPSMAAGREALTGPRPNPVRRPPRPDTTRLRPEHRSRDRREPGRATRPAPVLPHAGGRKRLCLPR